MVVVGVAVKVGVAVVLGVLLPRKVHENLEKQPTKTRLRGRKMGEKSEQAVGPTPHRPGKQTRAAGCTWNSRGTRAAGRRASAPTHAASVGSIVLTS